MMDTIHKAIAAAVAGALVGWTASALTLTGRVTAIEQTLVRIEARLDRVAPAGHVARLEVKQ
jgi:hypothetical protein